MNPGDFQKIAEKSSEEKNDRPASWYTNETNTSPISRRMYGIENPKKTTPMIRAASRVHQCSTTNCCVLSCPFQLFLAAFNEHLDAAELAQAVALETTGRTPH